MAAFFFWFGEQWSRQQVRRALSPFDINLIFAVLFIWNVVNPLRKTFSAVVMVKKR